MVLAMGQPIVAGWPAPSALTPSRRPARTFQAHRPVESLDLGPVTRMRPFAIAQDVDQVRRYLPRPLRYPLDQVVARQPLQPPHVDLDDRLRRHAPPLNHDRPH